MIQFNHTNLNLDKLKFVLHSFFVPEECRTFFWCVLLYRRDLLFLQPEVYSVHFLVWKKQTDLGWSEGEWIFSKFSFSGEVFFCVFCFVYWRCCAVHIEFNAGYTPRDNRADLGQISPLLPTILGNVPIILVVLEIIFSDFPEVC